MISMRKPILFSALLAIFVCPTLASYAGTTDSASEHGTIADSQNGTMRYTESGLTSASSADFRPMYVDLPPVAAEAPKAPAPVSHQPTTSVQGQTTDYIWTK